MAAGLEPAGGVKAVPGPVVQIDEGRIQAHLDEVVRATVEETLNGLLDAEADRLCGARKYERTEGRKDTRAGSYDRQLQTKAGEVTLTVPKLRSLPFPGRGRGHGQYLQQHVHQGHMSSRHRCPGWPRVPSLSRPLAMLHSAGAADRLASATLKRMS